MITIYEIINNASLIGSLVLGIYILSLSPGKKLNILFSLQCLSITFFIFLATYTEFVEEAEVVLLYKFTMANGALFLALSLQFFIELTRVRIKIWFRLLCLIPAIAVIILIFKADPILSQYFKQDSYRVFIPAFNELWFYCWVPFLMSHCFAYVALLAYRIRNTESNKEKRQFKIVIYSIVIALSIILVNDIILPSFSFYRMPYLCTIALSIYTFTLYYALVKYKFLTFDISNITSEIISNIQEMVLLLNPQCGIIHTNSRCEEILSITANNLKSKNFSELVLNDSDFDIIIKRLIKGEIGYFNHRIHYLTATVNVLTDTYVSRIIDNYGDFLGILVISHENKSIKQFRNFYNITDKQFEIIELLLIGLSNREIAERLIIHKRTVETHVFSIYNKLSIKNRVELLNVINDFSLIKNSGKNTAG